ncbi:bifunctional phosphoribosylaminoimidazolecarboxamide formyltransferase/IMP cyclohydrolase, partial [bacterium]|nr:bifunctional phosphoribosylaminoimidazolecarboxamide formyltransferase/IMP cyclohydrolase [bacterium]
MVLKKRALLSVSDKRFITNFARDLIKYGYELLASGGTYKKLKEAKIACKELSRVFQSPELLDGRVKTLNHKIFAAILVDRNNPAHLKELQRQGAGLIDLVVVNFYPFAEKVKPGKVGIATAAALMDIGGPAMVRAAAKNHRFVGVVSSVDQYREVQRHLKEHGELTEAMRLKLAADAFQISAHYEASIAAFFEHVAPKDAEKDGEPAAQLPTEILPDRLNLQLKRAERLRYGENPHQEAARYQVSGLPTVPFKVLQGKEMSYNNYLDASAALAIVSYEYPRPYAACVVKHHNPCGIAVDEDPLKAFIAARDADPESAFGGVVGLNCAVDETLANEIRKSFFEVVVAPAFDDGASDLLATKKNLRLIQAKPDDSNVFLRGGPKLVASMFGALLQSQDVAVERWEELQVVSNAAPPENLREDILLGLAFIRFLKSNAL